MSVSFVVFRLEKSLVSVVTLVGASLDLVLSICTPGDSRETYCMVNI